MTFRPRAILATSALALGLALVSCRPAPAISAPEPDPNPAPADDDVSDPDAPEAAPESSAPAGPCADKDACYAEGKAADDAKDKARAEELYRHGCALESGPSCNSLAMLIDDRDPEEAQSHKVRACELGNHDGCHNAAEHLRERDPRAAVALYKSACTGYAAEGVRFKLSLTCFRGAATAYAAGDYAAAHELGAIVCDDKSTGGCGLLGVLHAKGQGTPQDLNKAKALLTRGCEGGDKEACENAKKLDAAVANASAPPSGGSGLDVPNANITMGSVTVDGTKLKDLACRTQGGGFGALMAGPVLAKTIAQRKKKLRACAPKGGEARVRWTASGGRITQIEAKADSPDIERCVARVLKGANSPNSGTCAATIPLGK